MKLPKKYQTPGPLVTDKKIFNVFSIRVNVK